MTNPDLGPDAWMTRNRPELVDFARSEPEMPSRRRGAAVAMMQRTCDDAVSVDRTRRGKSPKKNTKSWHAT